jgi:hypothetical protein
VDIGWTQLDNGSGRDTCQKQSSNDISSSFLAKSMQLVDLDEGVTSECQIFLHCAPLSLSF